MRFRRRAPVRPTGTYTRWNWPPAPEGYRSFIWDLRPQTDPSPDGYFWSHQFWLVGGEAGYAGLQTRGSEPTGKIAIFSVWEALGGEGPHYAAPFRGEGSGFSVRIAFRWRVGSTYRLSVAAAGDAFWEARVGEAGGTDQLIGPLQGAPGGGRPRHASAVWAGRHAGPLSPGADHGHRPAP